MSSEFFNRDGKLVAVRSCKKGGGSHLQLEVSREEFDSLSLVLDCCDNLCRVSELVLSVADVSELSPKVLNQRVRELAAWASEKVQDPEWESVALFGFDEVSRLESEAKVGVRNSLKVV